MIVAIEVVWWLALLLALALTVLALFQIIRIVVYAREINHLAHRTLPAARGIAQNTTAIAALATLAAPAGRLVVAAQAIERTSAAIEGHTAAIVRSLKGA